MGNIEKASQVRALGRFRPAGVSSFVVRRQIDLLAKREKKNHVRRFFLRPGSGRGWECNTDDLFHVPVLYSSPCFSVPLTPRSSCYFFSIDICFSHSLSLSLSLASFFSLYVQNDKCISNGFEICFSDIWL